MNIEKLKNIKEKYDRLGEKTADPAVIADTAKKWRTARCGKTPHLVSEML